MNQKPHNHFILYVETPTGLEKRILAQVKKAIKRKRMEKITAGSITSIVFAGALVLVGRQIMAETATSGFGQYLSLIFSSGTVILSDWRDFAWTIVESAPITGFAICLGATGMFIAAVRWTERAWNGSRFNGAIGKFAV
jgi:hypothetical protein